MGVKRKQHSAEFKAPVAMASLSGDKTLAELSTEFGVHPTMISHWKQELVRTGVMPLCMWKLQLGWLVTETLRRPISSISGFVTATKEVRIESQHWPSIMRL